MLEGSMEFRFPIYDIFSGDVFIDAGKVWEKAFDYSLDGLNDLYYNAGIGLRVSTPIGPLRVDYATPIFEGYFKGRIFISIGHAF